MNLWLVGNFLLNRINIISRIWVYGGWGVCSFKDAQFQLEPFWLNLSKCWWMLGPGGREQEVYGLVRGGMCH